MGTTSLHHPCLSKMPTEQEPRGRWLLICSVLSSPDKMQLGEWHQGRAERKALAVLGDVGEQGKRWPRLPGTSLQGEAECMRVHLWSLSSESVSVCLWVPPFSVTLPQPDKPLLVCVQRWVLHFGKEVRQPLLPCLNVTTDKGVSHPCVSSAFSISSTAGFSEQEMGPPSCITCPTEAASRCPGRRKAGEENLWDLPQPPVLSLLSNPSGFSSPHPSSLPSSLHTCHPNAESSKRSTCGTTSSFHCPSPTPAAFTGLPQSLVREQIHNSPFPAASLGGTSAGIIPMDSPELDLLRRQFGVNITPH